MDSHAFRVIQSELLLLLHGARIEKIHAPHPGVTVFSLYAPAIHGQPPAQEDEKTAKTGKIAKLKFVLRHERQAPLMLFTARGLTNPLRPPAYVMRLRKYSAGHRLGHGEGVFCARALAFTLPSKVGEQMKHAAKAPPPEPCLVLDMVNGPSIQPSFPEAFKETPLWPDADTIALLANIPVNKKERSGPWQQFPVLTPFLRETLAALDQKEAQALMIDLEAGGGGLFAYANESGSPQLYSAWPLPDSILARRRLSLLTENDLVAFYAQTPHLAALSQHYPALALVSLVDEARLFAVLGEQNAKIEKAPLTAHAKKRARLLAKLEQEEQRLCAMLAGREEAKAIQSVLWKYSPDAKLEEIHVPSEEENGTPERCIRLNALLTIRENMARLFKESARGARGMAMLQARRELLFKEGSEESTPGAHSAAAPYPPTETDEHPDETKEGATQHLAEPATGPTLLTDITDQKEYRHVARFRSSDGFIVLRGKNAKGNHNLLRIGKGHDVWLHAEDGPSAHVIIRRAHAAEDIPERTLLEAARLAGEKSWQRDDARARIMVAQLKHVHPVKGGAPGSVKVDAVLQSIVVPLE